MLIKYPDISVKMYQTFLYFPFVLIYMWIPGGVALYFARKEKIRIPIFNNLNKYYLYAIFFPIVLSFLIVLVSMFFSHIDFAYLALIFPPSFSFFGAQSLNYILYFMFLLLVLVFYGSTINTFIALGQELMWRGYLFEKLSKLNFWHSSLIIGILWGIWYFPITIIFSTAYSGFSLLFLVWMFILTVMSTPLYLYLRNKGKSILVPSIFHGIFNAIAPYSIMFFHEPNQFLVGATGVASFIVWIIVNCILYLTLLKKDNV